MDNEFPNDESSSSSIPKRWLSDNESDSCTQCAESFTLMKRKHHCRVCGRIFCRECTRSKLLIPVEHEILNAPSYVDNKIPQRCCAQCARGLHSMQTDLRLAYSKANKETSINRDGNDRYYNMPFSFSLQSDIRKAVYTLYNFTNDNAIEGKDTIPRELLWGAKGIAFLTVAKVGFLFTGRIGSGLVISRLSDGSFSAPSAIMISGIGWGLQVGGEVTDVIIVLMTNGAVEAFSSRAQVSLGSELGVSVGPVGRSAGTDFIAGDQGASACISYAHCKGLFLGLSLEASIIASRPDINRAYYGLDVKPAILLSGAFQRPKGAEPLYRALSEILTQMEPIDSAHLMEPFPSHRVIITENSDRGELSSGNKNNFSTDLSFERELDDFRPTKGGSASMMNYKISLEEEVDDEEGVAVTQSNNYEEIRF